MWKELREDWSVLPLSNLPRFLVQPAFKPCPLHPWSTCVQSMTLPNQCSIHTKPAAATSCPVSSPQSTSSAVHTSWIILSLWYAPHQTIDISDVFHAVWRRPLSRLCLGVCLTSVSPSVSLLSRRLSRLGAASGQLWRSASPSSPPRGTSIRRGQRPAAIYTGCLLAAIGCRK